VNQKASKRDFIEVEMIKKLIQSYFGVIKKNISDSVPKTIVTLLVN
jgi:dynamin 1-like protein